MPINNALELAFKKAVHEKHTKKKALVADLLLHKKQSNQIIVPEQKHESKKTTSNERTGKSHS